MEPDSKKKALDELLSRFGGTVKRGSSLSGSEKSASPEPAQKDKDETQGFVEPPPKTARKPLRRAGLEKARCLADFYPQAEFIGPDGAFTKPAADTDWSLGAWRLTSKLSLDGSPSRTGAYMPVPHELVEKTDLAEASVFNPGLRLNGLELGDMAVLDVECTGLTSSAVPFLVGIGYFTDEHFIVEQYFMEDLPSEEPMYRALQARMADFKGIISFNGKSFDAPLLQARYIMNRMLSPFEKPHLDMLHPARRLFRGYFDSCSLSSLEAKLFGLSRISDVPGALIPRIYLEYIKGIRREQIIPVIDHNVQDIASTGALVPLFCEYFRNPDHADLQNPFSQLGLAAWMRRQDRPEDAIRSMERAVLACRDGVEEHRISLHIATAYKREKRWTEAVEIWQERFKLAGDAEMKATPCVELAKFYEHQAKDFEKAMEWVWKALDPWRESRKLRDLLESAKQQDLLMDDEDLGLDPEADLLASLVHRLSRLENRQARKDARQ
ncbi:MAG: ribonuclease H-like domain-containing protein [Candidatus Sumerlaeia bacterium]